jgi:hypothetical protein
MNLQPKVFIIYYFILFMVVSFFTVSLFETNTSTKYKHEAKQQTKISAKQKQPNRNKILEYRLFNSKQSKTQTK